ncbi:MAG: hypothetical protein ACUVWP_05940 [bacterium]
MNRILLLSLFIISILLFFSCEEEPLPEIFIYYPNPDQSEWNYIDVIANDEWNYKLNGTAYHQIYGPVQVLEITYQNNTEQRYVQLVDEDSDGKTDLVVFYYNLDTDARIVWLKYTDGKINVNDKWEWEIQGIKYNAVVLAKETVNVPAGKFTNCIKVQYSSGGEVIDVIWFANKVGIVRDALGTDYDLQLKSYNIPQ